MKKSRKWVVHMLVIAMLTGMMASCGADTTDTPATEGTAGKETESVETEKQPYIPSESYGGAEFRILTPTSTTALIYLFSEGENGDTLNDGVFKRNLMTEEWLDIDLIWEAECQIAELAGIVSQSVQAGDDTYQLVLADSMRGNTQLVSSGTLLDLSRIESIDFSHSYWNASALQELRIDDKVFFAKSSYTLPSVAVTVFNKQMVSDMHMGDLYALVREGKWTLDVFTSMIEQAVMDLDGDGKMTIADQYGMTCMRDYPLDCFIYACGQTMVKLNEEGRMEVALYNEDSVALYEKLYTLLNTGDKTFHWGWGDKDNADKKIEMHSGRTLFALNRTDSLYTLRDSEVDYGIIPYPKLNESQKAYMINDYSRLICIPVTVEDPEMAGKVCEMLGYYTEEYVYPAYYGSLMEGKVARDADSIEMLGMIFDSVIYDGGMSYFGLNGGGMQNLLYYISQKVINGDHDFASFYAKQSEKAQNEIDAFYESIQ